MNYRAFAVGLLAVVASVPLVYMYPMSYGLILVLNLGFGVYAFRRSQKKSHLIQKVLQASPIIIHVYNLKTNKFKIVNPETLQAMGFGPAKTSKVTDDFSLFCKVHPDDQKIIELHREFFKSNTESSSKSVEFRLMKNDDSYANVRTKSIIFSRDNSGQAEELLSFTEDFSEEKRLARELDEKRFDSFNDDKMMALGEMAGGVAHEINNPLAIILGHTQTIRLKSNRGRLTDEELVKSLEKIESSTNRISKITNSLKVIACEGLDEPFVTTSVSVIVEDLKMFWSERLANQKIDFFIEPFDESISIYGKPVQLILILINLLSNSFYAVKEQSDPWIRLKVYDFNDYSEIHIIDSGSGISAEYRNKLFDPFFTTRSIGEGRGLGLSVSASIAKNHGGSLSLNLQSRNTCFVLRLPKAQAARIAA